MEIQKCNRFEIKINQNSEQYSHAVRKKTLSSSNQMQQFHIRIDDSPISSEANSTDFYIRIENTPFYWEEVENISSDQSQMVADSLISVQSNEDLISISSDEHIQQIHNKQKQQPNKKARSKQQYIKLLQKKKKIQYKKRKKQYEKKRMLCKIKQREKNSLNNGDYCNNNVLANIKKSFANISNINKLSKASKQDSQNYTIPVSFPIISQTNFKRNFMQQEIIQQKNKESKLLINLMRAIQCQNNNIFELLKLREEKSQKVPDSFKDVKEYQKSFKQLHQCETLYRICQQIKQLKKDNTKCPSIQIQVISQSIRADSFCELSIQVFNHNEQKSLNLKDIISKHRLGLLADDQNLKKIHLVCFLQISKKKRNEEIFTLLSAQGFPELPKIFDLYDLDKFTTQTRDYDAITNLKYSELCKSILQPNQSGMNVQIQIHNCSQLNEILLLLRGKYNSSQFSSIKSISLKDEGVLLLQGPPGTGKTSALLGLLSCQLSKLEYISQISQVKQKILVCAPSNAAADHICDRIISQGLLSKSGQQIMPRILRVGVVQSRSIRSVSLFEIINKTNEFQLKKTHYSKKQIQQIIAKLNRQLQCLQNQIKLSENLQTAYEVKYKKYEQSFYIDFLNKNPVQPINIKEVQNWIEKKFITDSSIIITTLTSSFAEKITKDYPYFSCVIIDEAAQATQPNILVPFQLGMKKIVLIGDPFQLPPTTLHQNSVKKKYNRSLFERFLDNKVSPYFLSIQYRMSPLIRQFPSQNFYQNRLTDCDDIASRTDLNNLLLKTKQVVFISCINSQERKIGKSFGNQYQVSIICEIISKLLKSQLSIGVITPYQGQSEIIKKKLKFKNSQLYQNHGYNMNIFDYVTVSTVDSYQGQQRDIVIFSTVRANTEQNLGFTNDYRRVNVALTRAKRLLITIGHQKTLTHSNLWSSYIKWVKQKGSFLEFDTFNCLKNTITDKIVEKQDQPRHRIGKMYTIHQARIQNN